MVYKKDTTLGVALAFFAVTRTMNTPLDSHTCREKIVCGSLAL